MTVALYTNALSTHQMPLAREIVKRVGAENFRYIYTGESGQKLQQSHSTDVWIVKAKEHPWLDAADVVLIGGIRPIDLMERRAAQGLKTFYMSERWFKPYMGSLGWLHVPGWVRMFVPRYRRMAKRFVRLVNENDCVKFLAIGPWAKADFLRMGVKAEKIVDWGYFVESSRFGTRVPAAHAELDETCVPTPLPAAGRHDCVSSSCDPRVLRVFWAGRDLAWKRVKDVERAVALANKNLKCPSLNTYHSSLITFTKLTDVSPSEVRAAMREHDVFVLASNGYEGWGAVVSEALEEGMNAIGTWECGACPTLLPKERLYHCGDVNALARLIEAEYFGKLPPCSIGEWTAAGGAKRLFDLV